MTLSSPTQYDQWKIERRPDGVVVVRVPSRDRDGSPLPDAVFSFKPGSPQYAFWSEQLQQRESMNPSPGR